MRKLFLFIIVLLTVAVPSAQAFFSIASPTNTELGANVKIPVYNNSGAALAEGDVVVWDIGSSTGDDDLYITTTTTANTGLVAGVVAQGGIAVGSSGDIVVYGLAKCAISTPAVAAGTILCTSSTAGDGTLCSSTANESYAYAIMNAATAGATAGGCFVGVK